jgi:hypothetical protein
MAKQNTWESFTCPYSNKLNALVLASSKSSFDISPDPIIWRMSWQCKSLLFEAKNNYQVKGDANMQHLPDAEVYKLEILKDRV